MSMPDTVPRFNLWEEGWIQAQQPDGQVENVSIRQLLLGAHKFRTLVEPSPLAIVGIHRLLTAILQDIYEPQSIADLNKVFAAGRFDAQRIDAFGEAFADRFDLFSETQPFYQSADLPLVPEKKDKTWAVSNMVPELPKGIEATHYRHGVEDDYVLCPGCCAGGLVHLAAFATSGGPGIKPSINGVPPVYVLPMGETLFDSLSRSLMTPGYQPEVCASTKRDYWWRRESTVGKKEEVDDVGYGGSLTFMPRRMRLHPIAGSVRCSRCGREMIWGVRTMVFEMGVSRPKEAPQWFDPFVAYRTRKDKNPLPVRPREGRALWRDYCELFVPADVDIYRRPKAILQLVDHDLVRSTRIAFRCIGMRTDMKAKIFEWVDDGFDVPLAVLNGKRGDRAIRISLGYAENVGRALNKAWRNAFRLGKDGRLESVRDRMQAAYWRALAVPFRELTTAAADVRDGQEEEHLALQWDKQVSSVARHQLDMALETLCDDAETLRRRVKAQDELAIELAKLHKK